MLFLLAKCELMVDSISWEKTNKQKPNKTKTKQNKGITKENKISPESVKNWWLHHDAN